MSPEQVKKRIWMRCVECGDCKLWTGPTSKGGIPRMRLPGGQPVNPRRSMLEAMGVDMTGKVATTTCENLLCLSEEHAIAWTRKKLQKRSTSRPKSVQTRLKLRDLQAGRVGVLDLSKAREMRASGMTPAEAAEAYGVSPRHAARVLANEVWRDFANPFAGLLVPNDSQKRAA